MTAKQAVELFEKAMFSDEVRLRYPHLKTAFDMAFDALKEQAEREQDNECFYEYAVFSKMGNQESGISDDFGEIDGVKYMLQAEYPAKKFKVLKRLVMKWESCDDDDIPNCS